MAMIVALVVVMAAGAHVGAAVVARHRAQAAADLAALAGAGYVAAGAPAACARASALAQAMHTAAAECMLDGLDVVVTVEAPSAVRVPGSGAARAVARAGPVEGGS